MFPALKYNLSLAVPVKLYDDIFSILCIGCTVYLLWSTDIHQCHFADIMAPEPKSGKLQR